MGTQLANMMLPVMAASYLNWLMAAQIMVVGYLLGSALAMARYAAKPFNTAMAPVFTVLRAAPSFVVMFFLLAVGDREQGIFNTGFRVNGIAAVVISCSVYSVMFVSDTMLANFRRNESANLIRNTITAFPSLLRCFFICFLSTAAGAAVGVPEALGTALRMANAMASSADRLALLGGVVVFFAISMQLCMALCRMLEARFLRA